MFQYCNNGPMWVHSCILTLTDVSYGFSSVTPVRQLFRWDSTAIFYCHSDGYPPSGPWPGFKVYTFFRG